MRSITFNPDRCSIKRYQLFVLPCEFSYVLIPHIRCHSKDNSLKDLCLPTPLLVPLDRCRSALTPLENNQHANKDTDILQAQSE